MTNYPPPLFLSFACLWRIIIINNYSERCYGGTTLCLISTATTKLLFFPPFLSAKIFKLLPSFKPSWHLFGILTSPLAFNCCTCAYSPLFEFALQSSKWFTWAKPYMCVYSSSPLPLQLFWQWAAHQTNALSNHDSSTEPCNTIGPLTTCPE